MRIKDQYRAITFPSSRWDTIAARPTWGAYGSDDHAFGIVEIEHHADIGTIDVSKTGFDNAFGGDGKRIGF